MVWRQEATALSQVCYSTLLTPNSRGEVPTYPEHNLDHCGLAYYSWALDNHRILHGYYFLLDTFPDLVDAVWACCFLHCFLYFFYLKLPQSLVIFLFVERATYHRYPANSVWKYNFELPKNKIPCLINDPQTHMIEGVEMVKQCFL